MKRFSELISAIEITNKTNAKIEALVQYFTVAEDKDKLWMISVNIPRQQQASVGISANGTHQWLLI